MGNCAIDRYIEDGVVCPTLRNKLFTTSNLDNIDHNPSSTSARDAFHGTAISLTQHVSQNNNGSCRTPKRQLISSSNQKTKNIQSLPETYTQIPPVANNCKDAAPKTVEREHITTNMENDYEPQKRWLEKVDYLLHKPTLDENDTISWSAYFACLDSSESHIAAITSLLPLFRDCAHTIPLIKHGMNIIHNATNHVNPGQRPVMTGD